MANYYLGGQFKVSSPFGDKSGRDTAHNALDLAAPSGTPIPAIVGGKVTQVYKNNKTAGNGITIMGSDGREYRYIHMKNPPNLKVGDTVDSGMQIGQVGSTGNSTGPHLDLRVAENGRYIDPMTVLKGAGNASTSQKSGGSSYTNTWKTQSQALKAPGYQDYKNNLRAALNTGSIPSDWVVGLTEIIGRESTWNPSVKNKSSSAHGYGQFLSSTRKDYENKTGLSYDNPVNQIIMTAQYIKDRYGSPEKALQFWDKNKYY